MSKGRSRKVAKLEDPLIGCDKCGRWAYVSDIDFKNTREAENVDFVCRICKMIDEVDTTNRNKTDELQTTMTDMTKSGTPFPETYETGAGPHLQHENGMMQVQTEQQVATSSVKDLPSQVRDNSNTTTMNGTCINQRHIDEHIRPHQGVTREVIVAGDNNVARFASTLVDRVGDHRRMEILYKRGGTIADVHHLIDEYEEKARKVPRMYTLHVGVNDILHGEQPAAIVEQLRLKWTDHKDALAICSIPEIEGRGKGIQAATMLPNAHLKKLCKDLKARFIDLSRDLKAEDAMERGRLH
ncbi:hypothetical protein HPB47_011337 [Ixodes persulcatus]|uniref:Uncharacterized protein n=1 Tax=Ixodes persulcatus TaxID=34615 RepID=A0AC60NWJ6_IXOPE|nr:hypothetical protein HPB47_011337 [Ixodes persulcatus]